MGRYVLAAFPYRLSGARGRSPNHTAAFYCSPWAETPTGAQAAVWLRPSGRLGNLAVRLLPQDIEMILSVYSWSGMSGLLRLQMTEVVAQVPKSWVSFTAGLIRATL